MDTGFGFSVERGMSQLIHFISIYAGLEWLFLVALPSPDDMKAVKCWLEETAEYWANDDDNSDKGDNSDNSENDSDDDEENKEYEREEKDDSDICQTADGSIGAVRGKGIGGESGLSNPYCCVSRRTKWKHSNENVEVHFIEMSMCKAIIRNALRHGIERSEFSVDERRAVQPVEVHVMIQFREGVEPQNDL